MEDGTPQFWLVPGSSVPGRSENFTSRWSIDAIPLTWEVYVASRRNVVSIAGSPLTFSTTRHWPSPAIDEPARDFSVAGMSGVNAFLALACLPELSASPLGTASENDGLPPLGGGLYDSQSPNVTTRARGWSLCQARGLHARPCS